MQEKKQAILDIKAKYDAMDYDDWSEALEKANEPILEEFCVYLQEKGLAEKTINTHVNNVHLFVNAYQPTYDYTGTMFDGWNDFDDFIGYWFVRKCLWSSASSIRGLVASLKKFYRFLGERGYIEKEGVEEAVDTLKEGLSLWLDELDDFEGRYGGGW